MKMQINLLILLLIFYANTTAQWYRQNSGTTSNIQSVFFIDENTGWVCGSAGVILKTTTGGSEWFEQNSNTTSGLRAIQFVDHNNGWVYANNHILKTTNGGTTWANQNFPSLSYLVALQFINLNTGWLVYQKSDTSFINKTTDTGITWTVQSQSKSEFYEAIYFLDENYGWVAFAVGGVLKTTDGGYSWTQYNANFSGAPMYIRFVDNQTGWISSNSLGSYDISKSTNGGVTWFSLRFESFKFIHSISFQSSDVGYAAGWQLFTPPTPYEEFILKTTDGGTNWSEQYRDEGILNSIFVINDTIGWAAGDGGKILVTVNGGVTSVKDDPINPSGLALNQNFPNPFNPTTIIEFQITDFGFVTLKVYDILGREITTLVNETKPVGEYEVEFDGTGLPSGIYFYQLRAGHPSTSSGQVYIETKKMVLIK